MKRIVPIDVLKGLMLVIITVDHFGSPLKEYTWQTLGYVSATPGFIFLSGLLIGITYQKRASVPFSHTLKRLWKLYRYHIGSLFLIFIIYSSFPPNVGYAYYWKSSFSLFDQMPITAIWQSLVLWHQPDYFNLIPLYILLTAITPALLRAFQHEKTKWVLAISFLGWIVAQFNIPWLHQWLHNAFDFFAWQFIFVVGSYIGYHRHTIKPRIQKSNPVILIVFSVMALFFFVVRHELLPAPAFVTAKAIDRHYLGWLRLINFVVIAYLMAWIALKFPRFFSNRRLAQLGAHSLQVYMYQTILLYLSLPLKPRLYKLGEWSFTLFVIIAVISLSLPAWGHQWYQSHSISKRIKAKVTAFALLQALKSTKIT